MLGYTSTIAGGYSTRTGHRDGPAHHATFSSDFALIQKFCTVSCWLLTEIAQINMKPEDCAHETQKGKCGRAFYLCYYYYYINQSTSTSASVLSQAFLPFPFERDSASFITSEKINTVIKAVYLKSGTPVKNGGRKVFFFPKFKLATQ